MRSMPFMHWSDEYCNGIALFDAEHKCLIDMANDLYDAVLNGSSADVVMQVFHKLMAYTDYHFEHEEAFFTESGYPHDAAHIERHGWMRQQVVDFAESNKHLPAELQAIEMAKFLKNWLEIHILKDDREYARYLAARGVH